MYNPKHILTNQQVFADKTKIIDILKLQNPLYTSISNHDLLLCVKPFNWIPHLYLMIKFN